MTRRPSAPEKPFVTDVPFVETTEAVCGFHFVQCASREEALEFAASAPSPGTVVEVLPIVEF
ncbi:MAG: hypothetical protein H0W14_09755 [Actinobacteria bacterium]|nr:hypothetical protein [Actinomycetota bacterium]